MKILVVDWRKDRSKDLVQTLAEPNKRIVTSSAHVNGMGGNILGNWDDEAKQSCKAHLEQETPDVVLLHVGEAQSRWKECLEDIYQDHIVVCFTGRAIPEEVKADCASNLKHCYYPGAFAAEYSTEEAWRRSSEVSAILKFINGVEEYPKQAKDSQEAKGILQKAKETLQQFDSYLEGALNELTDDLCKLLQPGQQPTEQQLKDLTDKRNDLIGSRP